MKAQLVADVSDYEREILTLKLKEVTKAIDAYEIDDSKVKKLQAEIDQISIHLAAEQKFDLQLISLDIR
jgi:hypothetical protein